MTRATRTSRPRYSQSEWSGHEKRRRRQRRIAEEAMLAQRDEGNPPVVHNTGVQEILHKKSFDAFGVTKMNSPRKTIARPRRIRRGLSFIEFVGCILALGSGVAIGSVYLGVDMKTLLVGILERADLIDPDFFGATAAAEQVAAPAPVKSNVAQSVASTADGAEAELATTIVAAVTEDSPQPAEEPAEIAATEPAAPLTDQQHQAATLAYWNGLTACIAEEKAHRSGNSIDNENWQLFDYLTLRRDGHRKASEVIEQLDERGVDDRLLWHGRQVLSWHQAGAKLFGRAVELLTDAPSDQFTGPFVQSWQSAATQHRMEGKLVREKHFSVASYLDHTYKELAPFQPAF